MPEGYPMISNQGSRTTFTFRFPKFSNSALYDPLITGVSPPATTETVTTTASSTLSATTTPAASTVQGTMDLAVDDCPAFLAQPHVRDALADGIADAAGAGVTSDLIAVIISCQRRLSDTALWRRLPGATAHVDYVISIPPSTGGPVSAASVAGRIGSETSSTMTAKLTQAMQSRGMPTSGVSVAVLSTPTVVAATAAPTPAPTPDTSLEESPADTAPRGCAPLGLGAAALALAMAVLA